MLYVVQIEKGKLITHDGDVETGIHHMTLEKFLSMVQVEYQETYWIPDPKGKRYKRVNFQKTDKVVKKTKLE